MWISQWLRDEESACDTGDLGLIPALERSPGEGNNHPSSVLAWRIPWTEEPGGLQCTVSQRVGHDWAPNTHFYLQTSHMERYTGRDLWGSCDDISFWLWIWAEHLPGLWMCSQPGGSLVRILWRIPHIGMINSISRPSPLSAEVGGCGGVVWSWKFPASNQGLVSLVTSLYLGAGQEPNQSCCIGTKNAPTVFIT